MGAGGGVFLLTLFESPADTYFTSTGVVHVTAQTIDTLQTHGLMFQTKSNLFWHVLKIMLQTDMHVFWLMF